ncbi:MAG: 4Fe-4S dicluster domain-containing protein [Anaerolineaceae bacterium]|jgi:heterodisulfide reductase subunit C
MSKHQSEQTLAERVKSIPGGEHLMMCFSCGTCTSKCMIQVKADELFNPRRLIRETVFGMESEAFADPTTWQCSACDLCYPACPQKIHISGVIHAIKALAVEQGHKTQIKTAVVEQKTCVACGLCVEVCPYDAISLVETKVPFRGLIPIASVDAGKCMACGLCAASCRSTSIGLPDEAPDQLFINQLWSWLGQEAGAA